MAGQPSKLGADENGQAATPVGTALAPKIHGPRDRTLLAAFPARVLIGFR
jgi:hypothetical protein